MSILKKYNSSTGQWEPTVVGATGPSGVISVNAPLTNTGTSTSAVLGFANNPTIYGNGGSNTHTLDLRTTGGSSNQLSNLRFDSTFGNFPQDTGPRRTADIWAGFNGGAWQTEYLALGVGNGGDSALLTTERMRIDYYGRVTMPYQPAFCATANYGSNYSGTLNPVVFGNVDLNTGGHYSTTTGRFTAPIAGRYFFFAHAIRNGGNGYTTIRLRVNGVIRSNAWSQGANGNQDMPSCKLYYYLNANDYVDVEMATNQTNYIAETYWKFGGHLIG